MRTILVTGGTGQVGTELARLTWGPAAALLLPSRAELDIGSPDSIERFFEQHSVDLVVNSAAHTAVDRAESEVASAFTINALGPATLADVTREQNIPLIHLSTDYVFPGDKLAPYDEDDAVGPLGVYGASKLAGELAVRLGNPRSVVLRTAWVLSAHGSNFLKTMRRLSATRAEVNVVADQIGCPTSAADIAAAVQVIARAHMDSEAAPRGIYHFVSAGEASWCDLANAIFAIDGVRTVARPISTSDYPTPARRPANSRLSTARINADFAIVPRPWQHGIAEIIAELQRGDQQGVAL